MAEELPVWAVVLAGGEARRFGSDKLEARLGPLRVLELAIRDLPPATRLVLVGPPRSDVAAGRPISYVRENPPGGGPAAAMVAGLASVIEAAGADDLVLVLPGDTPAAGRAACVLLQDLLDHPEVDAVVGVGADDREQPLQLALRRVAAERLVGAAGSSRGAGQSARVLVATLGAGLRRSTLDPALYADIDTPADLERWRRGVTR